MPNQEEIAAQCLKALDLTPGQIPRYRTARYDEDSERVVVMARCGGDTNRALWQNVASRKKATPNEFKAPNPPNGPWIDDLAKHPGFEAIEDVPAVADGEEAAYAEITFKPAAEKLANLKAFLSMGAA